MRALPMGPAAVLIEDLPVAPELWAAGLRALDIEGVVDVVPAAQTVLVTGVDPSAIERLGRRLGEVVPAPDADANGRVVEIPVSYDGEDLADVAEAAGLTVDGVVKLHSSATYRAAFCGFAPGFAYLRGLPAELHLPRRETPRTSVPAGSVAIASQYSAVYPRSSPGGWHLLGHTDVSMFDPARERAAIVEPGDHVRFVPR